MAPRRKTCDPELEEMMSPNQPELMDNDGPIWVNKFTEDSARAFVKQLQFQSQRDPGAPIIIHVDSPGGDAYAMFTMIAAMEAVPNQLVTVAFGKAMSAGAILLAAGDIRYASRHSSIMIHEISAGAGGHIADMDVEYANIAHMNERVLALLAKYCKIKGGGAALKKCLEKSRDLYLSPEEAVKFGLIDKIGVPLLRRKISVEWGLMTNPREAQQQETNEKPAKAEKPTTGKAKV